MNGESDGKWQRRLDRERRARKDAESLLERKSLELFGANELLRKQAEDLEKLVEARTADLGRALSRAEAAVRAKADFLATISHEIRTPLNGILGLSELLEMEMEDESQRHHLGLLRQSGEILLALVNDLLDFSKIEAGHLEIESVRFDPAAELESILHTHLPSALARGIELHWQFRRLPAWVVGDSLRLGQILGNLLSNALKFTPSGVVRVEVEASLLADQRCQLQMSVADSGIGISPEVMASLFEPFSQGESSITRRFGGTGLGLAIVRRLARAMGGDVSVVSSPGEGSVFTCKLMFGVPAGCEVRPLECVVGADGECDPPVPDFSILLVEDNAINQTVALRFLRKLGRHADVASSGREAVGMVGAKAYDIIFMDMQMPEMDGLEATRRIRRMGLERQPRIIALTANASPADRERCFESGMDGFLAKPLRLEDFREVLCRVCVQALRGDDGGGECGG